MLCDAAGSVLGTGVGGPSNYHNTGTEEALASLRASFEEALAASGVEDEEQRGRSLWVKACFGLAGLDSSKDVAIMRRAIGSALDLAPAKMGRGFLLVNDWLTAVIGAFVDDPGVILIAGTGCVAAAQSEFGRRVARVGGWGLVVDDRGSAYDIGREALYASMRDYDGRGPRTKLLRLIMRKLGVADPQGIIARVYAEQMSVAAIASLSVLVSEAADEGDEVASRILAEKGRVLGELVVSAAVQLGMLGTRFGVSPHGGVFKAGHHILGPLEDTIRREAPLAELVRPKLPPACGAVVLLLRRAGVKVDDQTIARMRSSLAKVAESGGFHGHNDEQEAHEGGRRGGGSGKRGERTRCLRSQGHHPIAQLGDAEHLSRALSG